MKLLSVQCKSHLALSRDIVDTTANHCRVHFFLRNSLLPPVVTNILFSAYSFSLRRQVVKHCPEVSGPSTQPFPPLSALAVGTILFEICLEFRDEHPVERPYQSELQVLRGSDYREFGINIGALKLSLIHI